MKKKLSLPMQILIALISGIVLKAGVRVAALAIAHKVTAALFVVALIVLLVHKLATNKKA